MIALSLSQQVQFLTEHLDSIIWFEVLGIAIFLLAAFKSFIHDNKHYPSISLFGDIILGFSIWVLLMTAPVRVLLFPEIQPNIPTHESH